MNKLPFITACDSPAQNTRMVEQGGTLPASNVGALGLCEIDQIYGHFEPSIAGSRKISTSRQSFEVGNDKKSRKKARLPARNPQTMIP